MTLLALRTEVFCVTALPPVYGSGEGRDRHAGALAAADVFIVGGKS